MHLKSKYLSLEVNVAYLVSTVRATGPSNMQYVPHLSPFPVSFPIFSQETFK